MTDESLLLLCDLCDSAAHTYCVGLGATVPEGDWFCHDCAVSRTEHNYTEKDADADHQNICGNSDVMPVAEAHASIFDIVRESNSLVVERACTRVSSVPNWMSPHVVPGRGVGIADEVTGPAARTHQRIAGRAIESGARTLHRCRDVHNHIRVLRENWNALRNGLLSFSSSSVESGESSRKHNIHAALHDRSHQTHSSSSTNQQVTAWDGFSGDTIHNRGSDDIDKAWKMMGIAKSMQKNCKRTSSVHQASKQSCGRGNVSKQATTLSSGLHVSKSQQLGTRYLGSTRMEKQYSLGRKIEKHKSLKLEKQNHRMVTTVKSSEKLPTIHSLGFFESQSSRKVQTQGAVCHVNGARPLANYIYGASSNFPNEQGGSTCLRNLTGLVPGASDSLNAQVELSTSSCKVDVPERKVRLGKGCAESKTRKHDDAKIEIQSLVKLNLKLLSRDKQLGVDAFKEVARLATHTILAACGLEHPKTGFCPFPSSVCCHTEQIQQLHKSTLMPDSCRECFFIFVKDVVNSIMFEKSRS